MTVVTPYFPWFRSNRMAHFLAAQRIADQRHGEAMPAASACYLPGRISRQQVPPKQFLRPGHINAPKVLGEVVEELFWSSFA